MSLELQAIRRAHHRRPGEVGGLCCRSAQQSPRTRAVLYLPYGQCCSRPRTRTRHPGLGESTYRKHLADQVGHHFGWDAFTGVYTGDPAHRTARCRRPVRRGPIQPVIGRSSPRRAHHSHHTLRTRYGNVVSPESELIVQFGYTLQNGTGLYVQNGQQVGVNVGIEEWKEADVLQEDRALNA